MSEQSDCEHEHVPFRRRPLDLLLQSGRDGCQTCIFVLNALKQYHGGWIYEQSNRIEFSRVGKYFDNPVIAIYIDHGASIPGDYHYHENAIYATPTMELAFEPSNSNLVSQISSHVV